MSGFNFERNLNHQQKAIEATVGVFENLEILESNLTERSFVNPVIDISQSGYMHNLFQIRQKFAVRDGSIKYNSNIIDIKMETGTGKTYTYTKTIFELNKLYGLFKFIIVVPTLSIKAGTIDFLRSNSAREHFKEQYGKVLNLHIVESQKKSKGKKSYFPSAVSNFVSAGSFDKNQIQVLIINGGMINSETMSKSFDTSLFDMYSVPFDALAAIRSCIIIDEPHKFTQTNKTWLNIQKMKAQFILRYGATFANSEYENLVYNLTAIDAFNQNLVKGVMGHIMEFETGKNASVKLLSLNGGEASFEYVEDSNEEKNKKNKKITKRKVFSLISKDSLAKIHPAMQDLYVERMNRTVLLLSNGLELKRGDRINPYSYAETLQSTMIARAVHKHFELERDLLTREVKIKPLTLFFIDNIEEYRGENGYLRQTLENCIKLEVEALLKTETNVFYREYLQKTLADIRATNEGYFSKDNDDNESEDQIEKINMILHDKHKSLSLDNTFRFIFSKWTLREGWDNPNVFQICKLRSSGSEISKLQEVGRGLRLPVNEFGNRVKDEAFYLQYFVDFSESDFIEKLKNEINEKSGAIILDDSQTKLSEPMIQAILAKYPKYGNEALILLEELDEAGVIKRNNDFKEGGLEYMKQNFAPVFGQGIGKSKICNSKDKKQKVAIRVEKYAELKDLWEKLNQKVILRYNIHNEAEFEDIFREFLSGFNDKQSKLYKNDIVEIERKLTVSNGVANVKEDNLMVEYGHMISMSTMSYAVFLKSLASELNMNLKTLHRSLVHSKIDFNKFLNAKTISIIKTEFNKFLMSKAINTFGIEYQKVTNTIHPTRFTNISGEVKKDVLASDIGGVLDESLEVDPNFMLEHLFYDSELEKENILEHIKDVVVFTKIPKNSIKIPVAGGFSYSPDFAYVFNLQNGKKKLYFIVETKNTDEYSLRDDEKQRICHAEKFFGDTIKIEFKTQFQNKKITDLIREIIT